MSNVNQGGPAFPIPMNPGESYQGHALCDGMTMRDYFAAQALQGFLASGRINTDRASSYYASSIAENAYKLADAMIAQRNKGQ